METPDFMARRKPVYSPKACVFCGKEFQPATSKPTTCSWQCRFRLIQKDFEGKSGCWNWPQSVNKQTGYGQFHAEIDASRNQTAHRVSYLINKGAVPLGSDVMHSCDNRRCFNPDHLSAGSRADNLADMRNKGRANFGVRPSLEDHANSKLTVEAVLAIRSSQESDVALAERYGVSKSAVHMARRGITWKDIPAVQQSA